MPMTPDEVDILVAALDDCQDLVRKFARLRHPQMDRSYFGEIELLKHLQSAITQIQDYQKLRERVSVEKITDIILEQDFDISNEREVAQAIVTYLQQPTEH